MASSLSRLVRHGLEILAKATSTPGSRPRGGPSTSTVPSRRQTDGGEVNPGQFGPTATVEVRSDQIAQPDIQWSPDLDGDPDPGEVVWTWVPYEEADGRGKDRPVLVFARGNGGSVLAIQLSSRDHGGDRGWVRLGRGGWDRDGRDSWADTQRILRVHPHGMRREGDLADRDAFDRVATALRSAHEWQ